MMTPDDLIVSAARATAADALAGLRRAGISSADDRKTATFLRALEEACSAAGIDFAIAASHCGNETTLFTDEHFRVRRNPAGIGIPGPGVLGPTFPSYRAAARFYVGELLMKLRKDASAFADARAAFPQKWDDVAALVAGSEGPFPAVVRIRDLNQRFGPPGSDGRPRECVWMCDETGPQAICEKARTLFPDLPGQTNGGNDMPFTTAVPGLPGGPLKTTYPIRFNLIAIDGFQRTGQPARTPRRSVQHGTGNASNESAMSEAQFFVNGAEGAQSSVHACADDNEVVICVPLNEVTFQAADGGGPGNFNGLSCEMMEATAIWTNPARRNKLIAITADFMGRCSARLGIAEPEQHFDFNWVQCCDAPCDLLCGNRHDCPNKLRRTTIDGRPAWDVYAQQWRAAKANELERMQGDPDGPVVSPQVPDFVNGDTTRGHPGDHPFEFEHATAFGCLREWTVKTTTPRRFQAKLDSPKVGQDLQAGEKFPGWYVFKVGNKWWVLTKGGTRVAMDDLDERVTVGGA
jgi:hypothetical protein